MWWGPMKFTIRIAVVAAILFVVATQVTANTERFSAPYSFSAKNQLIEDEI